MKILKLIISLAVFTVSAFLCQQIITLSLANQRNKNDSAEINHIKYGLFSINTWKRQISTIVSDEIKDLNLSNANERELKKMVETQLGVLIDGIYKKIKDSNTKSVAGFFKQNLMDSFVDINDIKKGIPVYADEMIKEMTKSKSEEKFKKIAIDRIEKYFNKTFDNQDLTLVNRIIVRTGEKDVERARITLANNITINHSLIEKYSLMLVILAVFMFLIPLLGRQSLHPIQYFFMVLTLIVLLFAGITTPMIDMEAKISEMSFVLMDHPVSFKNQVLYFQSKSIMDVFWVMITHKDLEMKLVGVLLVCFSVVFPVAKLLSSVFYYYDLLNSKKNRLIQFFVLKSGKWSMADVMVVAIFMAYIGFNGILSSQLGGLSSEDQEVVFLTTNGTSLMPGYFLFLSYAVLGLFLSGYLSKIPSREPDASQR